MAQTDEQTASSGGSGKAFFDRAEEVAGTGNWDFAIEMYLQGIAREPGNIDQGHQRLREVALKRKMKGGKGPSLRDQLTRRPAKDPLKNLINAEFLLSKAPGSVGHMEQVLKSATALEDTALVKWIADLMLETQRQADKPSKRVLQLLTASYEDIEQFASAVEACERALLLSPDDSPMQQKLTALAARHTIQQGRYEEEGDFTKGIKDLEKQKALIQEDRLVQTEEHLKANIEKARQEYLADPTVGGKISGFVDALLAIEEETYENEAVDVLNKDRRDTGAYQFKVRIGDIRIRQMTRRFRKLRAAGDKAAAAEQARRQLEFELEEFTERSLNYPTDLVMKFELGRRQLLAGNYDDAIPSLQQAQRDPKRHLRAMTLLGQAFAKKEWYHEAAETFQHALESEMSDERAVDIRYSLGDVLEKIDDLRGALDQFSQVAQVNFQYKDVRDRVEQLRKKIDEQSPDEKTGE